LAKIHFLGEKCKNECFVEKTHSNTGRNDGSITLRAIGKVALKQKSPTSREEIVMQES
jgi:hypothetical protein